MALGGWGTLGPERSPAGCSTAQTKPLMSARIPFRVSLRAARTLNRHRPAPGHDIAAVRALKSSL